MERKEAIKLIEKDFDFVEKKVVNPLFWFDENGKEAIKLLLSTAKQVEKVVGKLKKAKKLSGDWVKIDDLLPLLTEEE